MANRWLYAGGDISNVRGVGFDTPISSTRFDSNYADTAIRLNASTEYAIADFVDSSGASDAATTGETVWVHCSHYTSGSTTVASIMSLVDGSDQEWLAVRTTAVSGTFGLYYNSGTGGSPVWTLIGSTFSLTLITPQGMDIKLTLGSPHSVELYRNGSLIASGTFTQASLTSVDAVRFATASTSEQAVSEIMATIGYNTVGGHVFYGKATGAGANTGWTGAYTTIDEPTVDDADLISSGTAGQRSTFAYSDMPALGSGYALGDAFMYTRAKNDGANPTNVKPVRRTAGGTDNVGSSFSGIGAGFANFLTRYTGLTETEYNGSQFGVESAA